MVSMTGIQFLLSIGIILLSLLIGYIIVKLPFINKWYLPASLIGGLILLIFGPQIAGHHFPEWQLSSSFYSDWARLPGLLINVVFASLFLGRNLVPLKEVWKMAAPQAAFGQTLAWGQYAIGGLVTLFILIPLFSTTPLAAALIEISFEGGHGTASGLEPVFNSLNFEVGYQMAVAMATLSLNAALISGLILTAWGRKKGYIKTVKYRNVRQLIYHRRIITDLKKQGISLRKHFASKEFFSSLLLVILAVAIGLLLHKLLIEFENLTWGKNNIIIFNYLPAFTLCMFGGMIAQKIWSKFGFKVSRPAVELISSTALSILIISAIATMKLDFFSTHLPAFLILSISGIVWILIVFVTLGPKIFKKNWFQNSIVNMAQSMGQTATGLLFVKIADPHDKTNAMESFGYKQLLFEPFMGGGIVTAMSMPLIILLGLPLFTAITAAICIIWIILGLTYFNRL